MKEIFLRKVNEKGGFVCHHAHFDKAFLITEENLVKSQSSLQEKWYLYRELKKSYTESDLYERMAKCADKMLNQGVSKVRTFVDADQIVGLLPIKTALRLKENYKPFGLDIQIAIQPLEGVMDVNARSNFVKACELADVIGGLPDRDENPLEHMDFIFNLAKDLGKPVDVHVDQNNIPSEKETEMVLDKISEHKLEGKVRLVHAISLACQEKADRDRVISKLIDTGTGVIVCPSAALSMRQQDHIHAPIHNSIAPVMEMLEKSVNVMLGVDNILDLFMPLVDGDLWFESRLLMESIRCYDLDLISDLVSNPQGFI